eukprot:2931200-Pleurochrysis_carterae.AAC.1
MDHFNSASVYKHKPPFSDSKQLVKLSCSEEGTESRVGEYAGSRRKQGERESARRRHSEAARADRYEK